jgi:hypothetical protein
VRRSTSTPRSWGCKGNRAASRRLMPVGGQVGLSEILMTNVAIVGGGPSGLYALKALAASPEVDEIALFETGERWGLGTPYDPALNHPSLLANIASFELPPLVDTLVDWLSRLSPDERAALGVGEVSARAFYPRVALGAYFEAQHDKLVARFGARVRAFRATRVGRRALRAGGRVDFVCERGPGAGERDVRFRHPRHRPPQPALCGPRRADRAGLPAARGTAPQAAARRRAWRLAHRHRRDAGDGVVAGRFHAGARGRGLPLARRRRAPQGDDVVTTGRAAGGGFLLSLS